MTVQRIQNYIDGEFKAPSDGKWLPHHNAWTGAIDSEFPDSDVMDAVRAIQSANKAWPAWQKVDLSERSAILMRIADALEEQTPRLSQIQMEDEGCSHERATQKSLPRAVDIFRFYARTMVLQTERSLASEKTVFQTHRKAHGLVLILTPYCDPFVSLALRVAPALAAGNVVIVKPSEFTPRAANAFAEVLAACGLPNGVFNFVHGRGEQVGKILVNHPGLSVLSFTGETETGRGIQREAAEFLKRTHLALGARNPVLIFKGIDLKKAMPAILSVTLDFHGQTCLRGSRVFVQETIHDEFLKEYKEQVKQMALSLKLPLNSAKLRNRFHRAVDQAKAERGKVLFGEEPIENQNGYFVAPTAIYDLTLCSTLQQEEVIGPFVTIASFKYQHDAIKNANTGPFGQAAYIFEAQGAKALRVAQKLDAGRIFINTGEANCTESLPSGGLKSSGLGRDGAEFLLEFFSKPSLIAQSLLNDF